MKRLIMLLLIGILIIQQVYAGTTQASFTISENQITGAVVGVDNQTGTEKSNDTNNLITGAVVGANKGFSEFWNLVKGFFIQLLAKI